MFFAIEIKLSHKPSSWTYQAWQMDLIMLKDSITWLLTFSLSLLSREEERRGLEAERITPVVSFSFWASLVAVISASAP